MVGLCRNYFDRFRNDNIDINAFSQAGVGEAALVRVFDQYTNALQVIGPEVMDFAGLEFQFLQWLEAGNLDGFKDGLSVSIARVYRPVVARVIEPPCGPVDGLLSPLGLRVNHLLSVEQGPVG